jgi:putative hydrolase of the HAD superfamily
MTRRHQAILFDLNGTVLYQVRSELSHMAHTYATLAPLQWETNFESFADAWRSVQARFARQFAEGLTLLRQGETQAARLKLREPWYRENIEEILRALELPLIRRWIEKLTWAYQDSWVAGLRLPPEHSAALEALQRQGYRLGLVTNFQQADIIPDILAQFGLQDAFEIVVISSAFGVRKPHPAIFQAALDSLGLSNNPQQAVHVGDHLEEDIAGAQLAGIEAILFNPQGKPDQFEPSIPHILRLKDLDEALQAFHEKRRTML